MRAASPKSKGRPTAGERFMAEALRLAAKGGRDVSPNPMVGAVLVKGRQIVARGYHRHFGGAHAEVDCLSRYEGALEGTTLYVTLEPCSHFGKTPPCAALLASTPISHVVVAMKDPNPVVAGKGIEQLRDAGKKVDVGVMAKEAARLNRRYMRAIGRGRPYVHVKVAQTLDGKISEAGAKGRWLTGPEARRRVHRMRADYDAILVGANTVAIDNPRLNVRGVKGRDPDVVVLDAALRVSESARVFSFGRGRRVFVCAAAAACRRNRGKVARLARRGVEVLSFPAAKGRIPLKDVLSRLYAEQIGSILVEGGAEIFGQFVAGGFVDEMSLFIAPRLSGANGVTAFARDVNDVSAPPQRVLSFDVSVVGSDLLLHALFD